MTIPPKLGAGKRVTLERVACPVNIAIPDQLGSAIIVGACPDSPLGPMVILGASAALPGATKATAMLGHLTTDEATDLAARLLLAASVVMEAQGKVGRA